MCLLVPRVTPIKQPGSHNYAEFIGKVTPEQRGQLLPAWAKQAVADGIPMEKLIRADGAGLLSKQQAVTVLNTDTVENMVAKLAEKAKNADSPIRLWGDPSKYKAHVDKRIALGHIKDEKDYWQKIDATLRSASALNLAVGKGFTTAEVVNGNWSVVLGHDGQIKTAYQLEDNKESFTRINTRLGYKVYGQHINSSIRQELEGLPSLPGLLGR
jgi:hypothetical protein